MALPWFSSVFAGTVWKRMVVPARGRRTHERAKGMGRAPTPQSGAGTQVLQERAGMAPEDPSLGVLHPTDHREQKRPVKGVTEGETQGRGPGRQRDGGLDTCARTTTLGMFPGAEPLHGASCLRGLLCTVRVAGPGHRCYWGAQHVVRVLISPCKLPHVAGGC